MVSVNFVPWVQDNTYNPEGLFIWPLCDISAQRCCNLIVIWTSTHHSILNNDIVIAARNQSNKKLLDISKHDFLLCVEGACYDLNVQPGNGPNRRTEFSPKVIYDYAIEFLTLLKGSMVALLDRWANVERFLHKWTHQVLMRQLRPFVYRSVEMQE